MDSDSILWPETLPHPRVDAKLVTSSRTELTQFETGRVRVRRLAETLWDIYDVDWAFTEDQFNTFKTFFEITLENASLSFVLDIFGEDTEVRFLEPEYTFNRSDNLFAVSAKLCTI